MHEILPVTINQDKKIKCELPGKEGVNLSQFSVHMLLYKRHSKHSARKLLELLNTFTKSKVTK